MYTATAILQRLLQDNILSQAEEMIVPQPDTLRIMRSLITLFILSLGIDQKVHDHSEYKFSF